MAPSRSPVVVTGMARSGTSWVGRLLQASGELTYVNEPLNPEHPPGHSPGVLRATVDQGYQYIHHSDDDRWLAAFNDTVRLRYYVGAELRRNRSPYDLARMVRYASFLAGRALGRRALVDDPYAMLASEWLADRVGCRVVVVVRDPAAIAGSWNGWGGPPTSVSCCTSRPCCGTGWSRTAGRGRRWRPRPRTCPAGSACCGGCCTWRCAGLRIVRYEDLSREVPLEHVPFYQKVVVRQANRWNRPVYVATDLLESMVTGRRATVAEADDIANTLLDGVHGLVLAAETAIGVDPVGTVDMVLRVVAAFERWNTSSLLDEDRQALARLAAAS